MRKFLIISLILIFLILLENVSSISLGSLVKNNQAELNPNESAEFTLLLWNSGESPIVVKFKEKSLPNDWFVIFKSKEIVLEPAKPEQNPQEGFNYISTSYGYVKATPVKIIIKTSDTTRKGIYLATITAMASEERDDIISLIQERDFSFKINITKDGANVITETEAQNNKTTQTTEEVKNYITDNATRINPFNTTILVVILIIILLVILIKIKYKS